MEHQQWRRLGLARLKYTNKVPEDKKTKSWGHPLESNAITRPRIANYPAFEGPKPEPTDIQSGLHGEQIRSADRSATECAYVGFGGCSTFVQIGSV